MLAQDQDKSLALYRFSLFLAAAIFLLILAGGLVTSREAGLAVPDWPLSYGRFFPPMVGNIFWEHGHRMIAGAVGILTFVSAIWVQISETRQAIKILAWSAFGAVSVQALLGGLTVLWMLPAPVSIAHACLAQTFFCLAIALAYFLNPANYLSLPVHKAPFGRTSPRFVAGNDTVRVRRLAVMTTGFIYLQLILGATIRHSGHAVIPHFVVALLVLLHVLLLHSRIEKGDRSNSDLSPFSMALGLLTLIQIFLGIGSFVFTRMLPAGYAPSLGEVLFTTAHQSAGALILGSAFFITLKVWR